MDTIYIMGIIIVIVSIVIQKIIINKKYQSGTGKMCTITAGKYSLCTPPQQGDSLNGKVQKIEVLFYREISREVIYKATDGFQIVGITYEYWD